MKREFVINILLLVVLNLLIKPLYIFGIDRTVQNVLGPDIYGGYYAALLNFVYLFQIVNDFGIQNYTAQHISKHPKMLAKYFPQFLTLKGILGIIFLLLVGIGGYLFGFRGALIPIILLLALNQIAISYLFYLRANIAAIGRYRVDSLLSVADKALMIVLCGLCLWGLRGIIDFNVYWFIGAQLISILITILIALMILRPHLKGLIFRISRPTLAVILRQSLPYALVLFLSTLFTRVDSVMIKRLLSDGDYEAGAYAAAFRLLETANMFAYMFAALLLPMFSRMFREDKEVKGLFKMSVGILWSAGIGLTVVVLLYKQGIMTLLYNYATPYWGQLLGMLMMGFGASAVSFILGALLLAKGEVRRINYLYLAGALLNILLNLWWIPSSHAYGAARATFITQIIMMVGAFYLVWRFVIPDLSWKYIAKMLIYCLLSGMGYWVLWRYEMAELWPIITICLTVIVLVLSAWTLGFIPKISDFREYE